MSTTKERAEFLEKTAKKPQYEWYKSQAEWKALGGTLPIKWAIKYYLTGQAAMLAQPAYERVVQETKTKK